MSQLLTCYRCPAAKLFCSRHDKARQDAKAGGFRSVQFRCDIKRDMYPVGAPATLMAWYPDYDDMKTEAVAVTILGWVGRKLRVQAEQPWETGNGDHRMIFKAWPDRVTPQLSAPLRSLCPCGYATTPLGSCVREARAEGCTCYFRSPSKWGFDPDPVLVKDEWCPLHGRNPDATRDAMMDDAP